MTTEKPNHHDIPYPTRFFDIETGALDNDVILSRVPEFDISEVKLGNTTAPDKIKEKLRRALLTHESKYIDRAALNAETGQVLAIGIWYGSNKVFVRAVGDREVDGDPLDVFEVTEKTLLMWMWEHYDGISPLIGFNIFGFDLPFLVRRSWILGVDIPKGVRKGRGWCYSFVDLMQEWGCGEYRKYISLGDLAKCLGVGEKSGSGKDFQKLFEEDREKALDYLRNDLMLTKAVGERLGFPEKVDDGRTMPAGHKTSENCF